MELSLSLLEKYCDANYYPVRSTVIIDENEPSIIIRPLRSLDSNLQIVIYNKTIIDILHVNNILGENGLIEGEKKNSLNDLNRKKNLDKSIEKLTYDTLAKYIIQMLSASSGKTLFKNLRPIPEHVGEYFRLEHVF
jgi:hypothetical protein